MCCGATALTTSLPCSYILHDTPHLLHNTSISPTDTFNELQQKKKKKKQRRKEKKEKKTDHNILKIMLRITIPNAGGRLDFTRGNLKPQSASSIPQALSCRFFGCNLLVFVFLVFRI